jgi:hypothetical protein
VVVVLVVVACATKVRTRMILHNRFLQ